MRLLHTGLVAPGLVFFVSEFPVLFPAAAVAWRNVSGAKNLFCPYCDPERTVTQVVKMRGACLKMQVKR